MSDIQSTADPSSDPPAEPSPEQPAVFSDDLLTALLVRFDAVTLLLSVSAFGAVGAAGALVVRTSGGWAGGLIVGLMLLAGAAIVASYVFVTMARQRLHDRLALIRDAAHELGGGDLSVVVPEDDDDLGMVGASLNTMRARVGRMMTAQRELLSGVSHELRSPLARIEVALALIDMELPGDEENELIVGIHEEVSLLERHISRLLEAQRVTRDRVVLTRKSLLIDVLVRHVISRDLPRLAQLGWRVKIDLHADDAEILGDENALDRVFSTLIENAIQHAASPGAEAAYSNVFEPVSDPAATTVDAGPPPADIEPTAGEGAAWRPTLCIETELDRLGVLIRFMDRGPGLSQDQCARAFEPFFRGDRSRSTSTGGTGLGMYLTRNILRAHGGDVTAQPRDGGGLMVELRLPLRGCKPLKETMRVQWSDARDDA